MNRDIYYVKLLDMCKCIVKMKWTGTEAALFLETPEEMKVSIDIMDFCSKDMAALLFNIPEFAVEVRNAGDNGALCTMFFFSKRTSPCYIQLGDEKIASLLWPEN